MICGEAGAPKKRCLFGFVIIASGLFQQNGVLECYCGGFCSVLSPRDVTPGLILLLLMAALGGFWLWM